MLLLGLKSELVLEAFELGDGCTGDEFRMDGSHGALELGAVCDDVGC